MKNKIRILCLAGLAGVVLAGANAQANTAVVDGTLFKQAGGTTFDTWKLNVLDAVTFNVNVLAYEATQNNTTTAGYAAADINGDGELTWLDPDTYFYRDTGQPLLATDALVRCDDIANNCSVYQNGLTAATSPVTVTTLSQAEGAADGSIHFRRDPAFTVNMPAGSFLYLVGDYRLDPSEAEAGINANDSFSPPTNFVDPITDHAAYRLTFSGDNVNFSVAGDTITVSAVPIPAAVWLFGSSLAGLAVLGRRKLS